MNEKLRNGSQTAKDNFNLQTKINSFRKTCVKQSNEIDTNSRGVQSKPTSWIHLRNYTQNLFPFSNNLSIYIQFINSLNESNVCPLPINSITFETVAKNKGYYLGGWQKTSSLSWQLTDSLYDPKRSRYCAKLLLLNVAELKLIVCTSKVCIKKKYMNRTRI